MTAGPQTGRWLKLKKVAALPRLLSAFCGSMSPKTPKESLAISTHPVLPNDINNLNNLFGGRLLEWMDIIAAVSAHRHCRRVVVTATVNSVAFHSPVPYGSIVTLEAKVSRAFKSSMEVFVDCFVEDPVSGEQKKTNEAIYTFVAVDEKNQPVPVPPISPETEQEKLRFEGALLRRQLALLLAGKLQAEEVTELQKFFVHG